MGSDILLGLIELLTNADDKYGDERGSILVRLPKPESDGTWEVQVCDKATGIAFDEIEPKLLRFGGRTSGHERGEATRGNRGRGAKDVSHFGRIRWDMVKAGKYSWVWIDRHGNGQKCRRPEDAGPIRDELGLSRDGVVATITCDRARFRRPQRDRIAHRLTYAVQLRNIVSNPKRTVKLQYNDEAAINLCYMPPNGMREAPPVAVEVKGYPGRARVVVAEVPTPFDDDSSDVVRQGGLLIMSGRSVHEATLFKYENSPYAGYFLGSVRWDPIDDLSRAFDDADQANLPLDPTNPFQIIRADRRGLNPQHPAVKALRAAVEEVLRPHIERKARELSGGGRETHQTKSRLAELARVIARFQAKKSEELDLDVTRRSADGIDLTPEVPILEVIPPRKLMEFGRTQTFSVRLRSDAVLGEPSEVDVLLSLVADPEHCVELSGHKCTLRPDKRLEGRMTGTFTARAADVDGNAMIEATLPGLPGVATEITVVEPEEALPPPPPTTFQFECSSYRVGLGKHKEILILAPGAAVARHGAQVALVSSDPAGVLIRHSAVELKYSKDGDWYQAVVDLEGRQYGASATVTAILGSGPVRAEVSVFVRRDETGPKPPVITLDAMASPVRGTYETDPSSGEIRITVNAAHPGVRRYFGPPPDFPAQESTAARLMTAEIVADLTVLDLLRRYHRQQPVPVEQLFRRRSQLLHDLLPLCHSSQVPETDLPDQTSKRRAPSQRRRRSGSDPVVKSDRPSPIAPQALA